MMKGNIYRKKVFILGGCLISLLGWGRLYSQQPVNPFAQGYFNTDDKFIDGCTAMMKEEYDEAVDIFEQILDKDKSHHASRYNLAKIAMQREQYDRVIDQIRLALKEDDNNFWYYELIRNAYMGKGDIARALDVQKDIVSMFAEKEEEQLNLIDLYLEYGKTDEALKLIADLESKKGTSEVLLYKKYIVYDKEQNLREKISTLKELQSASPGNKHYYRLLYDIYIEENDEESAMEILRELLRFDPEDGYALLTLFDYQRRNGNFSDASDLLIDVFGNEQVKIEWKVERLKALIEESGTNNDQQWPLRELSDKLKVTHPGNPQTLSVLGDVFRISEEWDSALVYYRKALEEDPAAFEIWISLLTTSQEQGDYDQMYFDAEEAIAFFPNNSQLLMLYAIASSRLEKWSQAEYALNKIEKQPAIDPALKAALLRERGWISFEQGNTEQALSLLKESVEIKEDAFAMELLGDILYKQGKREQAIKQWEKAKELGMKQIDIPSKLAQ